MLARSTLLAALALVGAGTASAQNITTVDLAGVEANFAQALLVPQFISSFMPQGTVDASWTGYDTGVVSTGQTVAQADTQTEPYLTVTPASNATNLMGGNSYTVMMVDANYSGADLSGSQYFHWLEYNVAFPSGSSPIEVPMNQTAAIPYVGPAPPAGSGPHRYVIMVYAQPSGFSAPSSPSGFGAYNFQSYISSAGLGQLVAAQYFQVVNSSTTATVTPSATSSVVTSTLAGASTSSGAAASGSGSSARSSGSASGSTASAAATSTKASAGERSVVVAAGGLAAAILGAVMLL